MVKKRISVVIPVYNESAGIEQFNNDILIPELNKLGQYDFRVIYVNDGSTDRSLDILHKLSKKDNRLSVLSLSRNFGKEIATSAGIIESSGEATIVMDSDGQHPPKLISKFIKLWTEGGQVVIGIRSENHGEGLIKKHGSKLFYKIFNSISDVKLIPRSTDFRLIDESVREEFSRLTERNRITRGMIDWLGFERKYIEFSAPERLAGEANYSVRKLISLATNSFVSLTLKPLFIFGWVGLVIMIVSAILGVFVIIEQLIMQDPLGLQITGTAMLGIFTAFMVGLVLISQAMIALYMSHIYSESRNRPLFIVDKTKSRNI